RRRVRCTFFPYTPLFRSILGVTSGAGFAITVGTVLGIAGSQTAQLGLALAGAVVASLVVYGVGRTAPLRLVLAGVAFTFVLSGIDRKSTRLNSSHVKISY